MKSSLYETIKKKFKEGVYEYSEVKDAYYKGWITRKELNEIMYKESD